MNNRRNIDISWTCSITFSLTCSDTSFPVNKLSRFMAKLRIKHWAALKRVLRYLLSTQDQVVSLNSINDFLLKTYCDVDWGRDKIDRKSQSKILIYLGENLLSWSSRKQPIVTKSNTESEFHNITSTTANLDYWVCSVLKELGIQVISPLVIFCDSHLNSEPIF